jgi:hypothetical protein
MIQNDDEKKYTDVIQKLKDLKKIDAPDYFEADLKRKLAEETPEEKSFWDKILLPSRLIPSAGLAAAAVILFFVININSEEMDNPFLIEPKLREDIIEVSSVEGYLDKDELRTNVESKEKSVEELDAGKGRQDVVGETKSGRDEPTMMMKKESSDDLKILAETESAIVDSLAAKPDETQPELTDAVGSASGMEITKQELNFRQVQLNSQEQQVVNELRNKMHQNQQKRTEYQK